MQLKHDSLPLSALASCFMRFWLEHAQKSNFDMTSQEKMRGQIGRLPVQALGYVNSTKVILGLPETAGVHFLLRPHNYILKVQFRNGGLATGKYVDGSVFYGYIREKRYFWMDKSKRDIYFHNLLGLKWHTQTGRNTVLSGQRKQQNVPAGRVIL